MDNMGIVIRELRRRKGLSLKDASKFLGRSTGWISSVENGKSNCRITQPEFDRIVKLLEGNQLRNLFKTWVANSKNESARDRSQEAEILRSARRRLKLNLREASSRAGISATYLCELECKKKPISLRIRSKILAAYNYKPSSFKNLVAKNRRNQIGARSQIETILDLLDEDHIREILSFLNRMYVESQTKCNRLQFKNP